MRDASAAPPLAEGSSGLGSIGRFAGVLGIAVVLSQLGQLVWLSAGSRTMSKETFGTVIAAQALYGLLQFALDNGTALYGARAAASGTLTHELRAALLRMRVLLAVLAAVVSLAVGAASGGRSLVAVAPFAFALLLFALFNYWEAFGLGDVRPWSAYLVARSLGPALAGSAFFAVSARFPVYLAGLVECAGIAAVALCFSLRPPLADIVRARGGPWRSVAQISLPSISWPVSLGSGPVLLNAFGAHAAAAALGVGLRLLTGVNQLSGIIATSLFPHLARLRARAASGTGSVVLGLKAVFFAALLANAVLLVRPSIFVRALLDRADREAEATAVVSLSAAAALGYLLVVSVMLMARGDEALVAPPYVVGALIVLGGGLAIAATSPGSEAIWMAACFALGQIATVLTLARLAARSVPELASSLVRSAAAACTLTLLPGVAYRAGVTVWIAALMALAGAAVLASVLRDVAALRARR